MLGRDLIIYILENHLEDKPILEDGVPIGYMSSREAAALLDVGLETINVWYRTGAISGVNINDTLYVPCNIIKKEEKT